MLAVVIAYPKRKEEPKTIEALAAICYRRRDNLFSSMIILNLIYKPLHSQ